MRITIFIIGLIVASYWNFGGIYSITPNTEHINIVPHICCFKNSFLKIFVTNIIATLVFLKRS